MHEPSTHQSHADGEVVLMLDEILHDVPRQHVLSGMHDVVRMRYHSRLEDQCEICVSSVKPAYLLAAVMRFLSDLPANR